MKALWFGVAVGLTSSVALAQTTIYKHVDESGRVTYTNRPLKGAVAVDLQPLSVIHRFAAPASAAQASAEASSDGARETPPVAVVKPSAPSTAVVSIDRKTQNTREPARQRALEDELAREEKSLAQAQEALREERESPALIAAVRTAQQESDPTPGQRAEIRANVDRASSRIRQLQATVTAHMMNIEALKKQLGALQP